MQLTVREAAGLLGVSERMIYRWLDEGGIPAHRIEEDVRFNRAELLEWATLRKLPISEAILREPVNGGSLGQALGAGGVHHRIAAADPDAILRIMMEALEALPRLERQILLDMLLARGRHAFTLVGDGIAIPHMRYPAVTSVSRAIVALYFLEMPADLKAPDGKGVDTIFFALSPTVRTHLRLLSRLAAALHDKDFRALLARKAAQEDILRELRRIEDGGA